MKDLMETLTSTKDFILGNYYFDKYQKNYIYIGHLEWFEWNDHKDGSGAKMHSSKGRKHLFFDGTTFQHKLPQDFVALHESQTFCSHISQSTENIVQILQERFYKTLHSQPIVALKIIKPLPQKKYSYYYFMENNCLHYVYVSQNVNKDNKKIFINLQMSQTIVYSDKSLALNSLNMVAATYTFSRQSTIYENSTQGIEDIETVYHMLYEKFHIGTLCYILKDGTEIRQI